MDLREPDENSFNKCHSRKIYVFFCVGECVKFFFNYRMRKAAEERAQIEPELADNQNEVGNVADAVVPALNAAEEVK